MKSLMLAWAAIAAGVAFAGPFEKAELRGVTDKAPGSDKVGEPIDFTVTLTNAEIPADAQYFVKWTRTGDDGKKESGKEPIANNGSCHIKTALAKPGFVRIEAKVVDAQGKDVKRDGVAPGENWFGHKEVFFSGGAAADIAKLKQGEGSEEPEGLRAHVRRADRLRGRTSGDGVPLDSEALRQRGDEAPGAHRVRRLRHGHPACAEALLV